MLKIRMATGSVTELQEFPLDSTMNSKKRTGWVFHSSKHSLPKSISLGWFSISD